MCKSICYVQKFVISSGLSFRAIKLHDVFVTSFLFKCTLWKIKVLVAPLFFTLHFPPWWLCCTNTIIFTLSFPLISWKNPHRLDMQIPKNFQFNISHFIDIDTIDTYGLHRSIFLTALNSSLQWSYHAKKNGIYIYLEDQMGIFIKMLLVTVIFSWICFMLSFCYYSKHKKAVMFRKMCKSWNGLWLTEILNLPSPQISSD